MDGSQAKLFMHPAKQSTHLLPRAFVERTYRLIEQQHLRLQSQRPRKSRPLLFSAAKTCDASLQEMPDTQHIRRFRNFSRNIPWPNATRPQTERNILPNRQMLEQGIVLRHIPDTPQTRLQHGNVAIVDKNLPGRNPLKTAQTL
jgi:hypothetical protein